MPRVVVTERSGISTTTAAADMSMIAGKWNSRVERGIDGM